MAKRRSKPTKHPITIDVTRHEPAALFLRESMMRGDDGHGTKIEVCKNINGDCLIFDIEGKRGCGQYTVGTAELARAIDALHNDLHLTSARPAGAT